MVWSDLGEIRVDNLGPASPRVPTAVTCPYDLTGLEHVLVGPIQAKVVSSEDQYGEMEAYDVCGYPVSLDVSELWSGPTDHGISPGDTVTFNGIVRCLYNEYCDRVALRGMYDVVSVDVTDLDMDGYSPPLDCDDDDPSVNPGADDIPGWHRSGLFRC